MRRVLGAALAVAAAVLLAAACAGAGRTARAPAVPGLMPGLLLPGTEGCVSRPAGAGTDTGDADADGLSDACELALTRAFAPALVVDARDCLWRPSAQALAGGYLVAAQPTPGGVRLAYLPAYLRDCGWSGAVCRLRGPGCGAHAGDSEFVLVDAAPVGRGRWTATGVFLSAHCLGRSDGRCRWYRGRALRAFAWAGGAERGAPQVWVARGKHAHYPTRRACDTGHWGYDSCDGNTLTVRFPVPGAAQNVGSRAQPAPAPGGCVPATALDAPGTAPGARECVWDPTRPFRGWQADSAGVGPTAYAVLLARFAGF